MRNALAGMEGDNIISATINLNSFSDASSLQPILENPLEKKSGSCICNQLQGRACGQDKNARDDRH